MTYNVLTSEIGESSTIYCSEHNHYIPLDPNNRHYQEILDAIIENGAACFDGDIPESLQADADAKQFAQQLSAYKAAVARLAQYELSVGQEEVREMRPTGDTAWNEETQELEPVLAEAIIQVAIEPLEATVETMVFDENNPMAAPTSQVVPNPLIVKDEEERAEAQAVVDATPQAVKDAAVE